MAGKVASTLAFVVSRILFQPVQMFVPYIITLEPTYSSVLTVKRAIPRALWAEITLGTLTFRGACHGIKLAEPAIAILVPVASGHC